MAVFKATKNKGDSAGKFKATKNRSYDSTLVYDWETRNKESYDALEKYRQRINSGGYLSADDLTAYRKALDSYLETSTSLRGFSKAMGHGKDDDDAWTKTIADMESGYQGISDYFSQWKTEDAFKKAIEASKEREAKLSLDTAAYGKELDALVAQRDAYIKELDASDSSIGTDNVDRAAMDLVGKIEELEKQIQERKLYLNDANRLQEGVRLASVSGNDDFDENSDYVSTEYGEGFSLDKLFKNDYGLGYEDLTYEYINNQNGIRGEIDRKASIYGKGSSDGESRFKANGYDLMHEDEIAIYNYYYAKEGKEAAEKYLNSIQETLNSRKAAGMYENLEDNFLLEMAFGVVAGIDQFKSGMEGLADAFSGNDEYRAPSATQMASGMVREDLADAGPNLPKWLGGASLGQVGYDAVTTTSNMLPSILTSAAVNFIAPGAGSIVGTSLLGASAGGNAYREMINLGYDKGQARSYATLVGGSEALLQYALGGISKLGGGSNGIFQTAAGKLLPHVDNAFARVAIKLGSNMLDEGLEEGLQEILTPWFQNMVLNADAKVNWSEVAYSSLLGALTAGFMEGTGTVSGEVNAYTKGRKLLKADISAERLAELGKTFAADTEAYQLAGKVNENTGAYTIGRLFNEIGATMTEQNVNDITNALVAKGWDEVTARKNAEALAYVVEGGQLTDRQTAIIEANEGLAEVARSVLIDANSTVNQRIKGYNEALMALAQEKTGVKSSRTNPAEQSEENAPADGTVDATKENGVESASEADTGPAKVKSIAAIKNKRATVALEDGTEAYVKDVDLDPNDGVRIETIASIDGISSTDANFILKTLRENTGASAQMDSLGAKDAYRYGFYGFSKDLMTKQAVFANSLTEAQRNAIYEVGQKARLQQIEKASPKTTSKQRGIYFDHGGGNVVEFKDADKKTLTEDKRKAGVQVALILNKLGIGGSIYFFESYRNAKGQLVYRDSTGKEVKAPNGWYSEKDGSIHIDLNAGRGGNGLVMFTLAHELTHFIEQWSPAKYKILADFLIENYEKGQSMDALIRRKQAKLSELRGEKISYDEAYSEVIADSMEAMLADGNVLEKLIELKAKDQSLFDKMKQFFDNLLTKIRNAYKGQAPDSYEGNAVMEMTDSIERIQQLFAEALVEASDNFQESLTPGEEGVAVNESGEPVAHATSDGTIQLSMRTYEEDGRKAFRDYLNKCVKNDRLTKAEMQEMLNGIEEIYQVCKEFKDKYAPFSTWSDAAVIRDTYGKPVFSVVTPNGDYKMNLDFSLVCKKRRTLDAVFNEMSKRGIIDDFELGQKSVVKINEIIRKYGLETACALCFVDAKRFRQASMADQFTSLYNELVLSLVPEDQRGNIDRFNFAGYDTIKKVDNGIHTWDKSKLDFSHLDDVMKNYGKGTVEHKAAKYIKTHAEGRRLLLRGDFMSSKGFDAVKTQNKDILKLYNSKKGTGGPKAAFGDVQYMNEIIKKSKNWTPEKAYAVGGVRIQSFSDYVPRMVFDYVQMIYDLAATKLPAHAYTKESLFVKQFGLTGIKINMSLIPAVAEGGIAPGLDANGNYVWAGESFDFDTAKEIQNADGYTENCGTICVGVSDLHIRKLLGDPDIRMVIPYHKSGLNPIVAHMNQIAEFTDYTGSQNTLDRNGSKLNKDFDFNKALHDMGENGDPKAVIKQYLDWCDKNGYTPKFSQFRDHPNYYKLIEDFTLYDKNDKYVPQREVRAVFPTKDSAFGSMKDLIQSGLEEDAIVEGKRDSSLSSIVDEIQNTLPKTEAEISEEQVEQADHDLEEVKNSDRDNAPTFYSLMAKVVDGVKQEKLGAASVVSMLRGKGVKAEEIKWSGIEQFLEGKKSVTKAELMEFVKSSTLQISTRQFTDERETFMNTETGEVYFGEAQFKDEAYRIADERNIPRSKVQFALDRDDGSATAYVNGISDPVLLDADIELNAANTHWEQYKLEGGKNYRELIFMMPSDYSNNAMRVHWGGDAEGILAHARVQDFDTEDGKMLFIEEIQSDWHNEGHKHGYNDSGTKQQLEAVQKERKAFQDSLRQSKNQLQEDLAAFYATKGYDTPDKAAENDLTWQGREFFGITQQVTKMPEDLVDRVKAYYNGLDRIREYNRKISSLELRAEHGVEDAPFRDTYHEYVLKNLLRMAAEEGYDSIGWTTADIQGERWSDEFAEGYRIEYDQEIPGFLKKYGKKWGTKVGKTVLDNGTEVWSMAITDEMQESVLTEGQPMYSERVEDSVSNRSLLANAFDGVAQNDIEKRKIQEYKSQISLINAEERKLSELNQKIKDLSFAKGPKDTKAIRDLRFEAMQTANRINTMDKILLRLEASKPLQDVLTREKEMVRKREQQKGKEALEAYREKATKTQRELMEKWQESRKNGIDSRQRTAMRHKIQNVVKELNDLLLNESKKRHVPDSMKKSVADALSLVNMDTVGAEERAAKYAALIAKETDPDKIAAYTVTMENILRQGDKMGQRLKELRDAYEEIQESDDPDIANAYDPVIAGNLKELYQSIGNTSLRNMTIEQLSDVYDMYKMVLTRVRDANKTLLENIKENISSLASRVIGEVRMTGGEHKQRLAMLDPVRSFLWNNLKPVYAMEHIGSATLTKVFNNIRAGEDTWAKDVTEAREYYLAQSKKYGYDKWDFKKKYRFQSASGLEFELTLEQILSLYAYSKRDQAADHLRLGGFVFDSNIETYKEKGGKLKYRVNTADAHQITPEILAEITGKLSKEQMGFVDEMQAYLSTTMGAKGNDVTMKMYGVKLFKEKFYFPLKSAKQFMFEQNEVSGEVKIKNSGFTNKVVAKANNPVILSNFMEVWSGHVNDMSMYHAFVLPLEDFNRVFNYNSPKKENLPSVSVKGTIQSAYSPAAVSYVKNLITDLNGGARTDPRTGPMGKLIGLHKKGAVFASLSVVVQQPSAIARAAALVDTKYFIGPKVDHKRHKALWDEVKQYAPVAIIKEMGYFDTNMGKSTHDYITGQEYSGFKEKMKALVTDSNYRDEILSKAPALADEIAWCSIWEAVKRETQAQHPGLDVRGEPFLMLAGARFTEVITKTQVYDSVLSRSANMRSKDTGMKMVTAFMAEPTTSINMIADALLQGKRGNRKYCRATIGAVIASQIINSILVSFVYAGRDDDEDETYAEKYIGTLTREVLDSLNPATYIPFIKDIVSIVQGYDVERSDMAIISDLVNAWRKLSSDNLSAYRKVEEFAGSIAQLFGLPVKNIMRDVRGIYQTIMSFVSGPQTTAAGIRYAIKGAITGKDVSNQKQLYEAYLSGDKAQIARVESRYKDQSSITSAIRKALRENDPRILEAAQAVVSGNAVERARIAREIEAEGHFKLQDIQAAINAEIDKLRKEAKGK